MSVDTEKYRIKRSIQLNVLCRLNSYVKSFDANIHDLNELEVRRDSLDSIVNHFEEYQQILEEHAHKDEEENIRIQFENMVTTDTQVKLPTIDLPKFSGDVQGWPSFRDLFLTLVHHSDSISSVQKFMYLKSALSGHALEIIQSIPVTINNYSVAWQSLLDRYDNQHLIAAHHLKILCQDSSVRKGNIDDLRKLASDLNQNMRVLEELGLPVQYWDSIVIYLANRRLNQDLKEKWSRFVMDKIKNKWPTFKEFVVFLEGECCVIESSKSDEKNSTGKSQIRSNVHVTTFQPECPICQDQHKIYYCSQFLKMNNKERGDTVKKKRLCFNCLKPGCLASKCNSRTCSKCSRKHNTLLHLDSYQNKPTGNQEDHQSKSQSSNQLKPLDVANSNNISTESSVHCASIIQQPHIFLWTAVVHVQGAYNKEYKCRVLLDNGSQTNFVTQQFVKLLKMEPEYKTTNISGVSSIKSSSDAVISLVVSSLITKFQFKSEFVVLPKITNNIPNTFVNVNQVSIPKGLQLADPDYNIPHKIDMLLGCEIFSELLKKGIIQLGRHRPTLHETLLGWVVAGSVVSDEINVHISSHLCTDITCNRFKKSEEALTKFWEQEEVNVNKHENESDVLCQQLYASTTIREPNGRYKVKLPLHKDPTILGDSFIEARRRFLQLEQRLQRDINLRQNYNAFMSEYIELNHMKLINSASSHGTTRYFIPHHPVIKESSKSTKLRVVFDASMKTDGGKGLSLNEIMMSGPVVQDELFAIILRFRMHSIVFIADIVKMYRQVNVHEEDQDLQCILWRMTPEEEMKIYKLLTVTYGTTAAPFLATRTLKQVGDDLRDKFPIAACITDNDFYVDDVLSGAVTEASTITMISELVEMLSQAGFQLSKWSSNSKSVLHHVSKMQCVQLSNVPILTDEIITALGLQWIPSTDHFCFKVNYDNTQYANTKRTVLSKIATIFDPLGLLGPIVIKAKIIMQELWKLKIGWDEVLPISMQQSWNDFNEGFTSVAELRILRQVTGVNMDHHFEIHGFSDASERAFGAVLYVRCIDSNGIVTVRLLTAKSRVAPVKLVSIPRLELCGALLLSQLTTKILEILKTKPKQVCLWSDSMIVLAWISSCPTRWKQYVANRVSEIKQLTSLFQWNYVNSKTNPADILSRGIHPSKLLNNTLWWNGPSWLYDKVIAKPTKTLINDYEKTSNIPEMRKSKLLSTVATLDFDLCTRISNWKKLINITCYLFRFIKNVRSKINKTIKLFGSLTHEEQSNATIYWIKLAQAVHFGNELAHLRKNQPINSKSKLLSLSPFLDNNEIIRVGGRLKHANLSNDQRHPIVLPAKHSLTTLLISNLHQENCHVGPQTLLGITRQRYWPINGKNICKKIVHSCVICFKANLKIQSQLMGDFPGVRINPAKPFLKTGVDFCGPIVIRQSLSRKSTTTKAYISVFVCMSVRAIHLEVVSDLTTKAFIAALQRFIARRGLCKEIYCDNGTNFVGASRHLSDVHSWVLENSSKFEHILIPEKIEWHFIPPNSPHMGGLWEACVKSVKQHLLRITGRALLTYEELTTVLTKIEACLNSRPITILSSDPNDPMPLTPAHFLIGDSLVLPIEKEPNTKHVNYLQRWDRLQSMTRDFWKQWSRDYLTSLQQRHKWQKTTPNLQSGEIVLIKEDNLPPAKWSIGRVIDLHPGRDGLVRVATVKTSKTTLKRPLAKLCRIPVEN